MMVNLIHNDEDNVIIEGDTIEEIRETVNIEMDKRGWLEENCWTEKMV